MQAQAPSKENSRPKTTRKVTSKVVQAYDHHITVTVGVRGSKPRVIGRRITVFDIAEWYLRQNQTVDDIVKDFGLTHAQVHAALAYYYDHRAEIDAREAEDIAEAEALREAYPSKLDE